MYIRDYSNELVDTLINFGEIKNKKILDIGCGDWEILKRIKAIAKSISGIDFGFRFSIIFRK